MKAYLYTVKWNKSSKMTSTISTDVIFEGALCNTVVANQAFHSTSLADKQICEMLQPTIQAAYKEVPFF